MSLYKIFAVLLIALLTGCVSGYKQFYSPVNSGRLFEINARRAGPPTLNPIVERTSNKDSREVSDIYFRRGYVAIGNSSFNSGRAESDDAAVEQAKEVGADLVLIVDPKYTGSITTSMPITTPTTSTSYSSGSATAYGRGGPVTAYGSGTTTTYGTQTTYVPMTVHRSDFAAVYFVKQRFGFGVRLRDLNDSERKLIETNRGAVIQVVADNSPAFEADIIVGDVIQKMDDVAVVNSSHLGGMLREHAGKKVNFTIYRNGRVLEKSVQMLP